MENCNWISNRLHVEKYLASKLKILVSFLTMSKFITEYNTSTHSCTPGLLLLTKLLTEALQCYRGTKLQKEAQLPKTMGTGTLGIKGHESFTAHDNLLLSQAQSWCSN